MERTGVFTSVPISCINQQTEVHESIDKIHRIKRWADFD